VGDFVKVAETAGFEPGMIKHAAVAGRSIAVANVDGSFYAIDSECTHRGGPLAEGELEGETLTCPWHGAQFNVKTGEAVRFPAGLDVSRYDVKIEGNDVLVEVPGAERFRSL